MNLSIRSSGDGVEKSNGTTREVNFSLLIRFTGLYFHFLQRIFPKGELKLLIAESLLKIFNLQLKSDLKEKFSKI